MEASTWGLGGGDGAWQGWWQRAAPASRPPHPPGPDRNIHVQVWEGIFILDAFQRALLPASSSVQGIRERGQAGGATEPQESPRNRIPGWESQRQVACADGSRRLPRDPLHWRCPAELCEGHALQLRAQYVRSPRSSFTCSWRELRCLKVRQKQQREGPVPS